MIVALWHKWIEQRQWWWLALIGAALLVDVFLGYRIVAWELRLLRASWDE